MAGKRGVQYFGYRRLLMDRDDYRMRKPDRIAKIGTHNAEFERR